MTAVERASAMLNVPARELPPLAFQFANALGREFGLCLEVILTAYAIYAQCVEGLPCDEAEYQARDVDRAWFAARTDCPGTAPRPE